MDKNPLGSTPPPPQKQGWLREGRPKSMLSSWSHLLLGCCPPWPPPKVSPLHHLPSPLHPRSAQVAHWTSHTAVKGPVRGGTWDLVLPTVFLVTGSAGGTAPTWDCSPLSGRNPQKASPGAAWPLLSAEPGSGRDVCVCTQVGGRDQTPGPHPLWLVPPE